MGVRARGTVLVGLIFVAGATADGRRKIRDTDIGPPESESLWKDLLRKLARRGSRDVKLVSSDSPDAIRATVPKI